MIVEDDAVTRKTLCHAIESEPLFNLVAVFDSMQPALAWLESGVADMLLTDLGLPDGSGVDIVRACSDRHPQCDIMVLTMSSDGDDIVACIEAGASGYILKNSPRFDVVSALLELRAGGSPISPIIARKILQRMRLEKQETDKANGKSEIKPDAPSALTKREASILQLIARGDSYGEVAKELSVSIGTVQTHIKNIYDKLSVHSRGEAVYEAYRRGLLKIGNSRRKESKNN